jgi:hypothetical protein
MTTALEASMGRDFGRLRRVRPARGTCRVIVEINGVGYVARPIPADGLEARRLIRLRKPDGAVYYVSEHAFGAQCDCPDFIFHRDGIDPTGCKHIKALAACGLLDAPEADEGPTEDRPWMREVRARIDLERDELAFGPASGARPASAR